MPKITQATLDKNYGGSLERYLEMRRRNAGKGGKAKTDKTKYKGFASNPRLAKEMGYMRKKNV